MLNYSVAELRLFIFSNTFVIELFSVFTIITHLGAFVVTKIKKKVKKSCIF